MSKSKPTAGVTAPDNNKRLALLEAGVSSIALALSSNGAEIPEGGNVFDTAIARIKHAALLDGQLMALIGASTAAIGRFAPDLELAPKDEAETLMACQTRLLEELATIETPCDRRILELEKQLAVGLSGDETNGDEVSALKTRVAQLELEVAELNVDVEEAMSEKNRLANLLADQGKSPTPPEPEEVQESAPAPKVRERPEGARDVGPTFGSLTAAELAGIIDDGARFEIAFSNGEYELVDFGPIYVAGDALHRFATNQYAVAPTLHIKGSTAPEEIHGAGLLLDGTQVGYCPFDPAVRIEPGQVRAFNRALIFG